MKLSKWITLTITSLGILTLVACSNTKRGSQSDIDAANSAYGQGAQTSGLGHDSDFGDGAGVSGERMVSKNVYYFDFDNYSVRSEDKPAIIANANYLLAHHNAKIRLEGHTDPRGSREYNIGLGERRANAVKNILIAQGVAHAQIQVVSYGAEKLASPGHSEMDYQQDRRVVLVYIKR